MSADQHPLRAGKYSGYDFWRNGLARLVGATAKAIQILGRVRPERYRDWRKAFELAAGSGVVKLR